MACSSAHTAVARIGTTGRTWQPGRHLHTQLCVLTGSLHSFSWALYTAAETPVTTIYQQFFFRTETFSSISFGLANVMTNSASSFSSSGKKGNECMWVTECYRDMRKWDTECLACVLLECYEPSFRTLGMWRPPRRCPVPFTRPLNHLFNVDTWMPTILAIFLWE